MIYLIYSHLDFPYLVMIQVSGLIVLLLLQVKNFIKLTLEAATSGVL